MGFALRVDVPTAPLLCTFRSVGRVFFAHPPIPLLSHPSPPPLAHARLLLGLLPQNPHGPSVAATSGFGRARVLFRHGPHHHVRPPALPLSSRDVAQTYDQCAPLYAVSLRDARAAVIFFKALISNYVAASYVSILKDNIHNSESAPAVDDLTNFVPSKDPSLPAGIAARSPAMSTTTPIFFFQRRKVPDLHTKDSEDPLPGAMWALTKQLLGTARRYPDGIHAVHVVHEEERISYGEENKSPSSNVGEAEPIGDKQIAHTTGTAEQERSGGTTSRPRSRTLLGATGDRKEDVPSVTIARLRGGVVGDSTVSTRFRAIGSRLADGERLEAGTLVWGNAKPVLPAPLHPGRLIL
ncbi:hypothetical protein C8F04DRAFT_1197082 [Mycena alexandri]|uniref:Uncharacterized protein n=1 Tax=Mycena alexandri TaxID=1745969 RepID=A0AAD6S2H8_9AGAR|nr:hypothetical protein C8F04DRAFT_1197082 [Mycena alexandri]